MRISLRRLRVSALLLTLAVAVAPGCGRSPSKPAEAHGAKTYTLGWTIYCGWMPWPYAQQTGIVKKWADRYHIKIKFVQINDYVEALNQYTAGKLDGVTSTNMDALTIPAAGGRDSTVVMVGDYSNGNDGIVLKGGSGLGDIKGRSVNLVQNSVSHYLLGRGLESAGLKLSDVKTVNTSDADIVAAFAAPSTQAVVAWNPQLAEIKKQPKAVEVFDSSRIPGEIEDTLLVSTDALSADPDLGKALVGIWYETLSKMRGSGSEGRAARTAMAQLSGTDLAGFEAQLKTTHLYYDPATTLAFMSSPELVEATQKVRRFSFAAGLFGQGAKSVDDVGIELPGGKVLGDPKNLKLRFSPVYVSAAAQGHL